MCGLAGELRFDQHPADLAAIERITPFAGPGKRRRGPAYPEPVTQQLTDHRQQPGGRRRLCAG